MYRCCRDADPSYFMKTLPILPTCPSEPKICSSSHMQKSPPVDSLSPNVYLPLWQQRLISPHQITIFMLRSNKSNKTCIFNCSHSSSTIFILSSFSLHTQVMVILILIDVQYLQNVVFTLEKVQMVKFTLPQIPTTQ